MLPAPATLTYGVPGGNPSRHVVFDAPADTMTRTTVTAVADGDRRVVTLTAGAGVTGAPAIFTLATAAAGCTVSEDADVPPGSASPGSGGFEKPPGGGGPGGGGSVSGGCGCLIGRGANLASPAAIALGAAIAALVVRGRRRQREGDQVTHARGSCLLGVLALVAAACGSGVVGTGTGTGGTDTGGTGGPGGISGGNGAPVILSFSATPASLAAAGQAMLRWQVTGADSLSIDKGVGTVTGNRSPSTSRPRPSTR